MDEILIEEKRYISSKQAAKMTGYAKDYVGQLCREGRVPARLVGRSWYVLESAIQDHRFGNAAVEPIKKPALEGLSAPLSAHFEAARYVSSTEDVLPSIHQPDADSKPEDGAVEDHGPSDHLQESWGAWFDRAGEEAPTAPVISEEAEADLIENSEPEATTVEDINVPIRAIHHSMYQPDSMEHMPRIAKIYSIEKEEEPSRKESRDSGRTVTRAIQIAGTMVAMTSIILAIIGTGYFDTYILSNRQVALLSGIYTYDK